MGHGVKGDYFPVLTQCFFLLSFGLLGPVIPFFLPMSPCWNENVYSIPVPPLYFRGI